MFCVKQVLYKSEVNKYLQTPAISRKLSTHITYLYAPHATVWIYIVISQRTSQSGNVKSEK